VLSKSSQSLATARKAVKSLLRGQGLRVVANRYGVDTKTLRKWRDAFVEGGTAELKRELVSSDHRYHFISYARKDEGIAKAVFLELYAAGINIWVDTDDIPGGAAWPANIDEAIKGAHKMILMLSPFSIGSREVWRELKLALEYGIPIIPAKLRPVTLPPKFKEAIGKLQVISLTQYRRERTGLLIDAIDEIASARVPRHQEWAFRHNQRFIAETLKYLQEVSQNGGNLIITTIRDDIDYQYYVQFAAIEGEPHIRVEAVGNANIPAKAALDLSQQQKLHDMGWLEPDKTSCGNYWYEFHCETDADRRTVAGFSMRTMLDVYRHLAGESVVPKIQFHG